jgi:hypothetical protein
MRKTIGCLLLAAFLAGAPRLAAAADGAPPADRQAMLRQLEEAQRLIQQGVEKMLDTAASALKSLPRYELPQMDENGDIIIRRKRPDSSGPARAI